MHKHELFKAHMAYGDEYEQLPMFVNPADIIENTVDGVWGSVDYIESYSEWGHKEYNALNGGGNYRSDFANIKDWREFRPVTMMPSGTFHGYEGDGPVLGNGHHRVAAANYWAMPLIPVIWDEDTWFGEESYSQDDNDWARENGEPYYDGYSLVYP